MKGEAVVDFIIVPFLYFLLFGYFKICLATEIMSKVSRESDANWTVDTQSLNSCSISINKILQPRKYQNKYILSNHCQKHVNNVRVNDSVENFNHTKC